MQPILTTITSAWNRPEALERWMTAIKGACIPEVQPFLYLPGAAAARIERPDEHPVTIFHRTEPVGESIGYYHNLGARNCVTEWIMKIDVDAIPHVNFFTELIPILRNARPREWFNCGMIYLTRAASESCLSSMPLGVTSFDSVITHRSIFSVGSYSGPASTNFICRREDYLCLGGCDERFKGWGWEDYQQIYMLEHHWTQKDPLPGPITLLNVTQRCRDEISRPKAGGLFGVNRRLCLLHHWHPPVAKAATSSANRAVLLDYITNARKEENSRGE